MKIVFASIPPATRDVTFLLNRTGPSNSEMMLASVPPSTFSERLTVTSSGVMTSSQTATPEAISKSSPLTVAIAASTTSSCPVAELTFLLPT